MEEERLYATLGGRNLPGYCSAVTGLCFAVYSNARVSPLRGTNWDEFIVGGKHAARFAAVILSVASAASNLPCRKPLACCVPSAKRRQHTNCLRLALQIR